MKIPIIHNIFNFNALKRNEVPDPQCFTVLQIGKSDYPEAVKDEYDGVYTRCEVGYYSWGFRFWHFF